MGMKGDGEADLHEIDRFDGGVGWIARSVALVALIVALWWPAAIGGAHLVARALAHR